MSEADAKLLELFREEAGRRCEVIAANCAALEGGAETGTEPLDTIRAEAHGLKGAAAIIGLEHLSGLAAAIEDIAAAQAETDRIGDELVAAVAAGAAAIEAGAVAAARGEGEPEAVEKAHQRLVSESG